MGNISVLHTDAATLYAYVDYLKSIGHNVFATTNNYKFILYAGEIPVDLMILDFDEKFESRLFEALRKKMNFKQTPVLLIMKQRTKLPPEITHFMLKPLDLLAFREILDKYTLAQDKDLSENTSSDEGLFYVDKQQKSQDLRQYID